MVEAAIAAPVFFLLLFAIIEFGLMFRDNLTLANTTRDGARAGSVSGDDLTADYFILQVVDRAIAAMPEEQIRQIIVFEAASQDSPVPPSCLGGPVAGLCNVYDRTNLADAIGTFGCGATSPDRFWCPDTRVVKQSPGNGGPPDLLGIYVRVERDRVSGFFPGTQTMEDTYILRLEPTDV